MLTKTHSGHMQNGLKQEKHPQGAVLKEQSDQGLHCLPLLHYILHTVKPVLNGQSKIDKTKILMTNCTLMKVKSIAEYCNTFDLH